MQSNKKTPAMDSILVVDDSEGIRSVFVTAFEEYKIITASNGEEALGILNKPNDVGIVILDVMMPGINGIELLREIKKINKNYKVVVMTAYSTKDVAVEALRSDADDYIEKPFDICNVKLVFDKLLKEGVNQPGVAANRVQNFKIQLAQRLVKRNYSRHFSLNDTSKEVFLSYKYLSRAFKEKTGKGFSKYRQELKIKSAKQLLEKSKESVSQIAFKVGYRNPDAFMKMFKKVTGMTPSEFRANNSDRGG